MPVLEYGRIQHGAYSSTSETLLSGPERTFGQAVCSNMLAYRKNTSGFSCPFIKEHLARIQHDSKEWFGSQVEFSKPMYQNLLLEQISRLFSINPELNRLRIRLLSPGSDLEVIFSEYINPWVTKETTGIALTPIVAERQKPELKLSGDTVCCEARTEAVSKGFDEALLISNKGLVLEGAWSNFFWIDKNQRLHSAASGVLPGISRNLILENFSCQLGTYALDEVVDRAIGAFVSQATSGITKVCRIDEVLLPTPDAAIFESVKQWHNKLVSESNTIMSGPVK